MIFTCHQFICHKFIHLCIFITHLFHTQKKHNHEKDYKKYVQREFQKAVRRQCFNLLCCKYSVFYIFPYAEMRSWLMSIHCDLRLCYKQVVACHRHLASCVGGSTDSPHLRQELRQTRERAQKLTLSCRQHLTSRLRDKGLPEAERKDAELLWVAFSSSLELFYADMCKVFNMGNNFSLANTCALVQTGMQGGHKREKCTDLSICIWLCISDSLLSCLQMCYYVAYNLSISSSKVKTRDT